VVYVWEAMFVRLFDSFLGKFVAYCFYIYICASMCMKSYVIFHIKCCWCKVLNQINWPEL